MTMIARSLGRATATAALSHHRLPHGGHCPRHRCNWPPGLRLHLPVGFRTTPVKAGAAFSLSGAGQAAMPTSSRACSRRSQSGLPLATTPSTAHRIIVGAQCLAKVFSPIRFRTPSRSTHATAPGTSSSAS